MKTRGIYLFQLFSVWLMRDLLAQPALVPAKEQSLDTLLNEHLFADSLGRGVLSNAQRKLITITTLDSLAGPGA